MTTNKKLVVAVVALSIALVCAIGGTLAFIAAKSNSVINTFTYGKIALTLTETEGTENNGVREFVENIVPGAEVKKDPTVSVLANSENCYVYAKVVNNVVLDGETVVTCNINTSHWTLVKEVKNTDGSVVSLYQYTGNDDDIVKKASEDTVLPALFETVTFADSIESKDLTALDAITDDIVITAYAHQADYTSDEIADTAAIQWAWSSN